jgi:hypothetical protein
MIIKVKGKEKERHIDASHPGQSRRDFLKRGLFTTSMMATLPHAVVASMAKSAFAGSCPVASAAPGGLAQIHGPGGGYAISSYVLNAQQMELAATTNSAYTNAWGITGGTNLVACFAGGSGVDKTSPFGAAILTPPPGVAAATWTAALARVSFGFNFGTATSDDGGGQNSGHIGSASPVKQSVLNKDINIDGNGVALAPWAIALGAATDKVAVSPTKLTAASMASGFGIAPATGTTGQLFANASSVGSSLGNLFNSILGNGRAGAANSMTAASCGFVGDAAMASSTFGTSLFTASGIPALTAGATVATLTAAEQAFLAAYYQSNVGQIGGVISVNPGADYHQQSLQQTVGPYDQQVGIQVRMWILAAMISAKPSAMIYSTNGSPGPQGTGATTLPAFTGGTTTTFNVNNPQGDDGGSFSGNGILLYAPPSMALPSLFSTGTITSQASVNADSRLPTVSSAIASHYLTALTFLGFNTTQFRAVLASNGVAAANQVNLLDG